MSTYDSAAQQLETQQQQAGGEGAFLSHEERQQVRRILKFPEEFPKELGAWVEDYMGTHGVFQKSQVQGLPLLFTQMQDTIDRLDALSQIETDYESGAVSTTATGYVDLTGGPEITGLDNGTYLCIAVAYVRNNSGDAGAARYQIHANGVATGIEGISYRSDGLDDNIVVAAVPAVSNGPASNTIKLMYKKSDAAGTANFNNRFLIVMRVA